MYNVLISLLIEKNVLDEDEGKYLVEKLESGVFPSDFKLAHQHVKGILEQYAEDEAAKKKTPEKSFHLDENNQVVMHTTSKK